MAIERWQIACKPEGKNPGPAPDDAEEGDQGTNMGGMIVYLVGPSGGRQELGRVGFVRANTSNPDQTFGDVLREFVETAREAVKMIAELTTPREGLQ